jgi:regulator of replication initiation timing
MIDSFITYDSNPAALSSPSYFSKHVEEIFKYNCLETENCGLMSHHGLPPISEEFPTEMNFEGFSNGSAYSTNPSTKHSPEHTPEMEDDGADDDKHKHSKVPPIVRKGIRKYYEPILDNNAVYRYEDDPNEYRKARKRIQNRESATRVRNRKKTHVEELADEIIILKQEKSELKVQNASLIAENNMLKQQIAFLERMVSRNPEDMIDNTDSLPDASRTETSDSILHLMNKSDEDLESSQSIGCKYFRAAPSHKFKKHVALLGVFTLLLCVYGLLPRSETGTVQLFSSPRHLLGRPTSNYVSLRARNGTPEGWTANQKIEGQGQGGGSIIGVIEIIVLLCYIVYLIYVALSVYKQQHSQKKRPFDLSPLPTIA